MPKCFWRFLAVKISKFKTIATQDVNIYGVDDRPWFEPFLSVFPISYPRETKQETSRSSSTRVVQIHFVTKTFLPQMACQHEATIRWTVKSTRFCLAWFETLKLSWTRITLLINRCHFELKVRKIKNWPLIHSCTNEVN